MIKMRLEYTFPFPLQEDFSRWKQNKQPVDITQLSDLRNTEGKNEKVMKRVLCLLITVSVLCAFALSAHSESGNTQSDDQLSVLRDLLLFFFPSAEPVSTPDTVSHQDIIDALRELGIEIPDPVISITGEDPEKLQQFRNSSAAPYEFALYLLFNIGAGDYDYDTGIWTPGSSDVYACDAEVFDIWNMYRLFLQGRSSIVPGFEPTEITEQTEEASGIGFSTDWGSSSEGTTTVSFMLNGKNMNAL